MKKKFRFKKEYVYLIGWQNLDKTLIYSTHNTRTTLIYTSSIDFAVKKEGWGGGGSRMIKFGRGQGDIAAVKVSGKTMNVSIGAGLPKDSSKCNLNTPYITR